MPIPRSILAREGFTDLDLHVEDFDAVLDNVRAQGGTVENEFRTQGPRPAAFCSDPFGNGFCVIGEGAD